MSERDGPWKDEATSIALLNERMAIVQSRVSELEKRQEETDRFLARIKAWFLGLAALGGIVGWIISVWDKLRLVGGAK